MKAAKGGDLFYESIGQGSDEFITRQRECIRQLPGTKKQAGSRRARCNSGGRGN